MKKAFVFMVICFFIYVFVVIIRGALQPLATVQAAANAITNTQYVTPTFIPTETPVPTATIGYEATLMIAQATADEARRVNAQVTAEHEAHILSIIQITAESERRAQEVLSWTQIAGPTIIPLTATQQQVSNTQVAGVQTLQSGQLTATHQAPTQLAAIVQIQDTEKYAAVDRIVRLGFMIVIGAFLVAVIWFIFKYEPPALKKVEEMPTETVVNIRRDNGQGNFSQTRHVVPCAPEQLTELAEMAVNGEKRFGINRLESASRTFKGQRSILIEVREFLVTNRLAIKTDDGLVTLNTDGEAFLAGWFDVHKLPDNYDFAPPPPLSHTHDTHTHDEKHGIFAEGEGENLSGGEAGTR